MIASEMESRYAQLERFHFATTSKARWLKEPRSQSLYSLRLLLNVGAFVDPTFQSTAFNAVLMILETRANMTKVATKVAKRRMEMKHAAISALQSDPSLGAGALDWDAIAKTMIPSDITILIQVLESLEQLHQNELSGVPLSAGWKPLCVSQSLMLYQSS